jgi:hypothetical protein
MYYSLEENCPSFHLYIFAFDNTCYDVLKKLLLPNASIIHLNEFENPELLAIKPSRTAGEYCWTCTPSTIYYCIQKYNIDHCTYIDADLLFFDNPKELLNELGPYKSILITEHRYTPIYDQSKTSGIYCVQFITFKNDENGMYALNWWKDACIEWCFNRFEDNKFGDQKYLDDWTERFKGVQVLQHLGGGVAPWNTQQYKFSEKGKKIWGTEISSGKSFPLIFYHFHEFRYCIKKIFRFADYYKLKSSLRLYAHYILKLEDIAKKLEAIDPNLEGHENEPIPWLGKSIRKTLRLRVLGHYKNYYKKDVFI